MSISFLLPPWRKTVAVVLIILFNSSAALLLLNSCQNLNKELKRTIMDTRITVLYSRWVELTKNTSVINETSATRTKTALNGVRKADNNCLYHTGAFSC